VPVHCLKMAVNLAYLLFPVLALISLGLGATLTWTDFKKTKPKQVLVGWCCQFGIMPLLAFIFAKVCAFELEVSIGMVLIGIAPGSTSSNLFTYWSNGNLSLSIVMVITNTISAFFMFPLLVLIYIDTEYYSTAVKIDFLNIVLALLVVLIPVSIGVVCRHLNQVKKFREKFLWEWLEKITSAIGALFVVVPLVFGIIQNSSLFSLGPGIWFSALLLEPFGCFIGYWVTILCGLSKQDARTIALQTGIQSATLVIAIISLTFTNQAVQDKCLIFPLFYSFWYIINSCWITLFLRRLARDDKSVPEVKKDALDSPTSPGSPTPSEQPTTSV